jgi:hypothetical protein
VPDASNAGEENRCLGARAPVAITSPVLSQLISVAKAVPLGGLRQIGVLIAFSESDLLARIRQGVCRGTRAPGGWARAEGKNIDIDVLLRAV